MTPDQEDWLIQRLLARMELDYRQTQLAAQREARSAVLDRLLLRLETRISVLEDALGDAQDDDDDDDVATAAGGAKTGDESMQTRTTKPLPVQAILSAMRLIGPPPSSLASSTNRTILTDIEGVVATHRQQASSATE